MVPPGRLYPGHLLRGLGPPADPAALPADFREFATPTVLIDSPEAAKDWQNYKPEFDFSRPFDCRVAG